MAYSITRKTKNIAAGLALSEEQNGMGEKLFNPDGSLRKQQILFLWEEHLESSISGALRAHASPGGSRGGRLAT